MGGDEAARPAAQSAEGQEPGFGNASVTGDGGLFVGAPDLKGYEVDRANIDEGRNPEVHSVIETPRTEKLVTGQIRPCSA